MRIFAFTDKNELTNCMTRYMQEDNCILCTIQFYSFIFIIIYRESAGNIHLNRVTFNKIPANRIILREKDYNTLIINLSNLSLSFSITVTVIVYVPCSLSLSLSLVSLRQFTVSFDVYMQTGYLFHAFPICNVYSLLLNKS